MSTKSLPLTAIVLVLSVCQLQADVINSRWVGGDGAWESPSNWSPAIVPDNTSFTTFSVNINGEDINITLQNSHTIDHMDCNGDVQLWSNGALLRVNNGLINHDYLSICRVLMAYLHIKADVTNLEGAFLELGFGEIRDNLYNQVGGIVQSEYVFEIGDDIENAGLIIIRHGGHIYSDEGEIRNSGILDLRNGTIGANEGPFCNKPSGKIRGFGMVYSGEGSQEFQNEGTVCASGGSLLVYSGGVTTNTGILTNDPLASLHIKTSADVNNLGTLEIKAGGGIAFDCNMVNEPNAVIKLFNGTLAAKTITQKAGAVFQGFGGITGNVVIEPNALVKLTGPTNIVGDVTIEEGATLDISDGTVLITGLTTCNGGTIKTFHGSIITQGGTLGICQTIIVN